MENKVIVQTILTVVSLPHMSLTYAIIIYISGLFHQGKFLNFLLIGPIYNEWLSKKVKGYMKKLLDTK